MAMMPFKKSIVLSENTHTHTHTHTHTRNETYAFQSGVSYHKLRYDNRTGVLCTCLHEDSRLVTISSVDIVIVHELI